MERKRFQAFDRQRIQQNERLAGVIGDVEGRCVRALTDDGSVQQTLQNPSKMESPTIITGKSPKKME